MYQRRNKFNPLWNDLVVGGFEGGKPYLGTVDSIATHYNDDHIATGS
jgi:20S proteasome subunit beta 7